MDKISSHWVHWKGVRCLYGNQAANSSLSKVHPCLLTSSYMATGGCTVPHKTTIETVKLSLSSFSLICSQIQLWLPWHGKTHHRTAINPIQAPCFGPVSHFLSINLSWWASLAPYLTNSHCLLINLAVLWVVVPAYPAHQYVAWDILKLEVLTGVAEARACKVPVVTWHYKRKASRSAGDNSCRNCLRS